MDASPRADTDHDTSQPKRVAHGPCVVLALVVAACAEEHQVTWLGAQPAHTATARSEDAAEHDEADEELNPRLVRRFRPLGVRKPEAQALVDLGRMLYFEPLLSSQATVSCNSCHPLDRYGTTSTPLSTGVLGRTGKRNAPTTYNVAGHVRWFWDGRAATLEEQALMPIENPLEMDMVVKTACERLASSEVYGRAFAAAFGTPEITAERMARALATFERGLVTPAAWDRYLEGDRAALTVEQKRGARLFANLGCVVCHTGPLVGGTMFEKLGEHIPWPNREDRGRRAVTGNEVDDMVFKVPSLRNVAETAPYFHDGSAATLPEAVRLMARHQLGLELEPGEVDLIVAWLVSLTGELPTAYVAPPAVATRGTP